VSNGYGKMLEVTQPCDAASYRVVVVVVAVVSLSLWSFN